MCPTERAMHTLRMNSPEGEILDKLTVSVTFMVVILELSRHYTKLRKSEESTHT